MRFAKLNFSRGLEIFGETAFIFLSNHDLSYLNISLKFSVCRLYHLRTPSKIVRIENGIYNEVLDTKLASLIANQPEGHICILAPELI